MNIGMATVWISAGIFLFVSTSLDELMRRHETLTLLCLWGIAMLSYHQDLKLKTGCWAYSQVLAVVSLIALVVFGITHGEWWNFLIVAVLVWLHMQLTRRWLARPGAWW